MRKFYLFLVALVTLSSLQSCEDNGGDSSLGPIRFLFLVDKHSDLYKDMEKAFAKNDYTKSPEVYNPNFDNNKVGFNNVYFLKGEKKSKLREGFQDSSTDYLLHNRLNIKENYAYIDIADHELWEKIITNKEEDFLLIYDKKKLALKIKGRDYGKGEHFFAIEKFYINGKKAKILNSGAGYEPREIVLFLTE